MRRSAKYLGRCARSTVSLGAPQATSRSSHRVSNVDSELLPVGSQFAGYRIDGVAGVGAMSHVYRATHIALGRIVALKLVKPDSGEDEIFRRRFQREARITALLDHPNVVTVYSHGQVDRRQYIAMRYVDGPELDHMLRTEGPLEPARACRIIAQVAAALDVAHTHGIVHRDPKAGNILVEGGKGREHAYLSGFGFCKDAGESAAALPGQALGSLDYMSPEQIRGEPFDARADVYILACVSYRCLTGHEVFEEVQGMRILWAHLQDPPPSLRSRLASIPESLDRVICKALAKDPASRYASAGEFAAAASAAATAA